MSLLPLPNRNSLRNFSENGCAGLLVGMLMGLKTPTLRLGKTMMLATYFVKMQYVLKISRALCEDCSLVNRLKKLSTFFFCCRRGERLKYLPMLRNTFLSELLQKIKI